MLTSKEFNAMISHAGQQKLLPAGFAQHNNLFYLYRSPNVLVFLPGYYKYDFDGFYLAMTHDFLSGAMANGKPVINAYPENYPFTISIEDLADQYKKHNYISRFTYDTSFTSRMNKNSISLAAKMKANEGIAEGYINESMDKALIHGLRLIEDYTPAISYWSVTKYPGDTHITRRFRDEIKKYYSDRRMKMKVPGRKWYHVLFGG